MPLGRAISPANPANNGESLTPIRERAIPWEVENEESFFDPVTTEAKAEMTFVPIGKSVNVIRRRPSEARVNESFRGEGIVCAPRDRGTT